MPPSRTPLVMVFKSQSKTICLINQGQQGTSIFLMKTRHSARMFFSHPAGATPRRLFSASRRLDETTCLIADIHMPAMTGL